MAMLTTEKKPELEQL